MAIWSEEQLEQLRTLKKMDLKMTTEKALIEEQLEDLKRAKLLSGLENELAKEYHGCGYSQITYSEHFDAAIAKKEKPEFIPTEDQRLALLALNGWWKSLPFDDGYKQFGLFGYAGTGKTTVIQQFIGGKFGVVLCAPTHKAVGVIDRMAKDNGLDFDSKTLHSLLALRKSYDNKGGATYKPDPRRQPPIAEYRLVVLDECSMVGESLWSQLIEAQKLYGFRLIAMGDPLQLPPVNDGEAQAFKIETSATLYEIVRNDGAIAELVEKIRLNVDQMTINTLESCQYSDQNPPQAPVTSTKGLAWLEAICESFAADPSGTKALAFTNDSVDWINDYIREKLGYTKPFETGERLVAKTTVTYKSGDGYQEILLHTEDGCTVFDAAPGEWLGLQCWALEIETDFGESEVVHCLDSDQKFAFRKALRVAKKSALDKNDQGTWRDYYELSEAFAELRPGFATTVHKSQGSTYRSVFIAQPDIDKCKDMRVRNQLMYVAYSRASERIIIYKRG